MSILISLFSFVSPVYLSSLLSHLSVISFLSHLSYLSFTPYIFFFQPFLISSFILSLSSSISPVLLTCSVSCNFLSHLCTPTLTSFPFFFSFLLFLIPVFFFHFPFFLFFHFIVCLLHLPLYLTFSGIQHSSLIPSLFPTPFYVPSFYRLFFLFYLSSFHYLSFSPSRCFYLPFSLI